MSSHKHLNRRSFLRLTSAGALAVFLPQSGFGLGAPTRCAHCGVELLSHTLLTRAGKCRNCGADARTGERAAPQTLFPSRVKTSRSKKAAPSLRGGAELPFPHPDLRGISDKPCAALADIRSRKSKVRWRPDKTLTP